jgi:hypothetical protein
MILLGLHGLKRSGKTTVCRYLVDQYGFAEVSFAAPIYRGIAAMFDLDPHELQAEDTKERNIPWLGCSPRKLLQTCGTEWARAYISDDVWIRVAARAIERHRQMGAPGVVVSDVRFDNEAQWLLEQGAELWLITRPVRPVEGRDTHASEAGISTNWPMRGIVNAAGFPHLYQRVDELLAQLGAPQ